MSELLSGLSSRCKDPEVQKPVLGRLSRRAGLRGQGQRRPKVRVKAEQWGNRGSHEEEQGSGVGRMKQGACRVLDKNQEADFPGSVVDKNPSANAGDSSSIPGPGRSHMQQSN